MSSGSEWFAEEAFWDIFYECMFNEETFHAGKSEIHDIMNILAPPGESLVDLGCGPGRHAVPLALAGYQVTGIDLIPGLLDRAEHYGQEEGAHIQWQKADMREFDLASPVDGIVCMWTSFGYFDSREDDQRVLEKCRDHLRSGGRLMIDTVGKEVIARDVQPVHLTEYPSGRLLIERPLITERFCRYENEWLLIDGERVHRRQWGHWIYSASELCSSLEAAGFVDIEVYGNLQGDDYDQEAERLIVAATRG